MALRAVVTGKGTMGDLNAGWSVSEYATPTDASAGSSSTNAASFSAGTRSDTQLLADKTVALTHVSDFPEEVPLGTVSGPIQSVNPSGANTSFSQKSIFTQLNVDRKAQVRVPGSLVDSSVFYGNLLLYPWRKGILNVVTDDTYTYVMYKAPFDSTSVLVNKIRTSDHVSISGFTTSAVDQTVTGMAVAGDYIIVQTSGDTFRAYHKVTGVAVGTSNYKPFAHGGSSVVGTPHMSITPLAGTTRFMVGLGSNAASSGYSGRIEFGAFEIGISVGVPYVGNYWSYSGTQNIAVSGGSATVPAWPTAFRWLNDSQVMIYGPAMTPANGGAITDGWGLYNIVFSLAGDATNITRYAQIVSPYGTEHGATNSDENGMVIIGDHQFDSSTGIENFAWPQLTSSLLGGYDGTNWKVLHQMRNGNAQYFISNGSTTGQQSTFTIANVKPRVSLSDIFAYYFSLVFGTATPAISWQASVNPVAVLAGWVGNVWDHICQLCVAYRVELVIVAGVPTVRDLASNIIDITDLGISPSFTVTSQGSSRTISVDYYNARTVSAQGRQAFNVQNLIRNPSFKNNLNDWTAANSNTSLGRVTSPNAYGRNSIAVAPVGGGTNSNFAVYGQIPGSPVVGTIKRAGLVQGQTYVFQAWGSLNSKQKGSLHRYARRIVIRQYKSDGSFADSASPAFPNVANVNPVQVTVTAKINADTTDIALFLFGGAPDNPSYNDSVIWSMVRTSVLGQETPALPDDLYYDGDSPGWSWGGTSGNSTSFKQIPAVAADNLIYDAYKDNNVLSVDVNGVETTTIETNSYPVTLDQPIVTDNLYESRYGYYYVSASDNLPVTAAQWAAYGGKVTVAQNADEPSSLDITVVGPRTKIPGVVGPFRLAASDGQNDYAFLSVTGTGVRTSPQKLVVSTGANEVNITQDEGGEIDNFAVGDVAHAQEIAFEAAANAGTATGEISFTIPTNKISAFGVTPGSVFTYKSCNYRVTEVAIHNLTTDITAQRYTLVDDVASWYDGMTVDQMTALWAGYTTQDSVIMPFRAVG